MDKLIANASVGLAKASMNRRGFLGKLAGAAGGAAVLTAAFSTAARADHCSGSHRCERCWPEPGACSRHLCGDWSIVWEVCEVIDCYTRESCGVTRRSMRGCGYPYCG